MEKLFNCQPLVFLRKHFVLLDGRNAVFCVNTVPFGHRRLALRWAYGTTSLRSPTPGGFDTASPTQSGAAFGYSTQASTQVAGLTERR